MREKRPRRLTIKKVPKFLSGCMGGRRWLMGSAGVHTDHMAPSDGFAACCGIIKKKKKGSLHPISEA